MIFETNLSFKSDISSIIIISKCSIYFLKCKCTVLQKINSLAILYNTLVKSSLLYENVVGNPYSTKGLIKDIEYVQHQFLRFPSYRTLITITQTYLERLNF